MSEKLKEFLKSKSNYLNVDKLNMLGIKNKMLRIDGVSWEKFKDNIEKLTLSFEGVQIDGIKQRMVLGKANTVTLIELFGDDENAWIGKEILLAVIQDNYKGKVYDKMIIAK